MPTPSSSPLLLSQLLYTNSRLLIQAIQTSLNEFGLTYLQYLVLSILWEKDGLQVHQLGEPLSLDSGTLTPLLKKLESQHLIKRKRGEADERTVTIHLTFQGKTLQSKTLPAIHSLEEKVSLILGPSVEGLIPGMEELSNRLKTKKDKWKS